MRISTIYSIKAIEHQYRTGEEPVLVFCSDMKEYVCKYMRSSAAAYKMACELIGAQMARAWQLNTPEIAFVKIKSDHWSGRFVQHSTTAPALGSRRLESVVDITPSTIKEIEPTDYLCKQLLKIALFDFWIANEDRNANNANLLYDVGQGSLVSIDYGCILNTATFEYPLSQLTSTDTILCSETFSHISQDIRLTTIEKTVEELRKDYQIVLRHCAAQVNVIVDELPKEWNVSPDIVRSKLQQLLDVRWTNGVWDNFMECLKENI